jgi:hypothetical protein
VVFQTPLILPGSRESKDLGIYVWVMELLEAAFFVRKINPSSGKSAHDRRP